MYTSVFPLPLTLPGGVEVLVEVQTPGAVEDFLVATVAEERGALPLLAFAVARIWAMRSRADGLLSSEAYHSIVAVGGALAQHAEATIDRIGRGEVDSHCVLMYHSPLSANAQQRLGVLRQSSDGFAIAQKDLELRGPGEVLGTRQTGEMQFRIADVTRDQSLLPAVQQAAELMLERFPQRLAPLVRRWIGQREEYINA